LLSILQTLWGFVELVLEFFSWREDWHRTWSPVSFWLAVVVGMTLVACGIYFGRGAWEHLRLLIWTSS
jgi:hypothetical protein